MAEPAFEAAVTMPSVSPETPGDGGSPGHGERLVFTDDDVVIETPPADTRSKPALPDRGSALAGLRNLAVRPRSGGGGRGPRPTKARSNGDGGFDLRNTWQILAGSILVPLGVVFILMAWYGAAHTAYVQQQIPYLVSGSFVGLGCLVLGGLLYWAHWLYRLYDQNDMHHEETLRALEQTLRAFMEQRGDNGHGGLPAPPVPATPSSGSGIGPIGGGPVSSSPGVRSSFPAPAPSSPPPPTTGPVSSQSGNYVVTPSGSVYHLPSCPVIAHHSDGLRVLGPAAVADMEPCRICLAPGT